MTTISGLIFLIFLLILSIAFAAALATSDLREFKILILKLFLKLSFKISL